MITKITFNENGIKDFKDLKPGLIVLDIDDIASGARFSSKLGLDFYPRVKKIEKSFLGYNIYRETYSGYMLEKAKIKSGVITTNLELKYDEEYVIDPGTLFSLKCLSEEEKKINSSLENAKIVFLVGRGIGNIENLNRIKNLAKKVGAEVGCTRPVCMNNWESYDNFVGISGKSLNCDLCVTFGVSGSGPLIKGLENVKKIVSINNDKNALIFNYSDYGIIKDLNIVLEELESELK